MSSELAKTWNEVAARYYDYDSPLRPVPEDLEIIQPILARWHAGNSISRPKIFLCGVTPDIVKMQWPFEIDLTAMDQADAMVKHVWPGDVPGVRRATVANWLKHGMPDKSIDIVLGDGGFGFFRYPDQMRDLMIALHAMLKPGGFFLQRVYIRHPQRESLDKILADARAGRIGNFHVFKWRVAMSMQENASVGARQCDVWNACTNANLDTRSLPQPGWSDRAVGTIDFYKNKQACIYYPTLEEFQSLMSGLFESIEVIYPTYEIGELCPYVIARAAG